MSGSHQMQNTSQIVFIEDSENSEIEDWFECEKIIKIESSNTSDEHISLISKECTNEDVKLVSNEYTSEDESDSHSDNYSNSSEDENDSFNNGYSDSNFYSDSYSNGYDDLTDDEYSQLDSNEFDDYNEDDSEFESSEEESDSEYDSEEYDGEEYDGEEYDSEEYDSEYESNDNLNPYFNTYNPMMNRLYTDSTSDDDSAYSDSYYNLQSHHNGVHTSLSDNVIDLSNADSIDAINDDFDGRRATRFIRYNGNEGLPNLTNVMADNDVVVLESMNLNEIYPRINYFLVTAIVERLHNIYFGIKRPSTLSCTLRTLTEDEMKFLRLKVKNVLMSIIRDSRVIKQLMEFVCKEKIDEEDAILGRKKIASTYFKDMVNVESKSCGICYGEFKSNHKCSSLKCLHTFHSKCIKKWIKQTWCCPLCRSEDIQ